MKAFKKIVLYGNSHLKVILPSYGEDEVIKQRKSGFKVCFIIKIKKSFKRRMSFGFLKINFHETTFAY
jgi:hypothetical protein